MHACKALGLSCVGPTEYWPVEHTFALRKCKWHACILSTAGAACWSRARHLTEGGSLWEGRASRCCWAREALQLAPLTALGTKLCCQAPAWIEQPLTAHVCSIKSV